jgi:hypothetical protein
VLWHRYKSASGAGQGPGAADAVRASMLCAGGRHVCLDAPACYRESNTHTRAAPHSHAPLGCRAWRCCEQPSAPEPPHCHNPGPHLLCCPSKHVRCGCIHVCIADVPTRAGSNRPPVECAGGACHTHPALPGDWLVNHTQDGLSVVQQGDESPKQRLACLVGQNAAAVGSNRKGCISEQPAVFSALPRRTPASNP